MSLLLKSLLSQNYPAHKACEWNENRKNRVFGGTSIINLIHIEDEKNTK